MKLIIFDFDGPINNLIKAKKDVINKISKELSLVWSEKNSWELINYIDQIYELEKTYEYSEIISKSLKKMVKNKLTRLSDETIKIFSKKFSEEIKEYPSVSKDIKPSVEKIRRLYKQASICIYTSQTKSNVIILLEYSKIEAELFDKIYDRNYFEEPKPSTVNLIKICEEFNIEPKEAVAVGDNVAVDLAPASYLGMRTILINPFVTQSTNSLQKLPKLLK